MLTAISAHALIKFIWRFIPNSSNLKNLTKVSHYMMFILHVCRSWTLVWLELLTRRSWWPPMSSLDTTELLRSLSQQNTRRTVGARAQYMGVYVCVGGRWMVGGGGRGELRSQSCHWNVCGYVVFSPACMYMYVRIKYICQAGPFFLNGIGHKSFDMASGLAQAVSPPPSHTLSSLPLIYFHY